MASKIIVDQIQTGDGTGTIALQNQLSGMTAASMPTGSVLQVKFVEDSSSQTVATDSGNGAATNLTLSITPFSTSSKILALWNMQYEMPNSSAGLACKLMRGSTVAWQSGYTWEWLDSPSTASAVTYTINAITESGNAVYLNTNNNKSQLTLMEIKG